MSWFIIIGIYFYSFSPIWIWILLVFYGKEKKESQTFMDKQEENKENPTKRLAVVYE
jgi:hypothetical protein